MTLHTFTWIFSIINPIFFSNSFFGSFGAKLAVPAIQFWGFIGRRTCVGFLGSNFLAGQGV